MKHFFLDTNILLDFLIDRGEVSEDATALIQNAINKKCRLYCSSLTYSHVFYITRKIHGTATAKKNIKTLLSIISALPMNESHILEGLATIHSDLDDGIQYQCCIQNNKMDALITRDRKAFPRKKMTILNPKSALALLDTNAK